MYNDDQRKDAKADRLHVLATLLFHGLHKSQATDAVSLRIGRVSPKASGALYDAIMGNGLLIVCLDDVIIVIAVSIDLNDHSSNNYR